MRSAEAAVASEHHPGLTYENFLSDPLIRLVMESDGISVAEMAAVLEAAGNAVARREHGRGHAFGQEASGLA